MKPKQLKALEILVRGEFDNYDDVAAELKISPRTLYNWRNEDEFAAELERRLRIKLGGIAPRALRRQEELLDAESEMVAHLAAKDILDRAGYKPESKKDKKGSASDDRIADKLNEIFNHVIE